MLVSYRGENPLALACRHGGTADKEELFRMSLSPAGAYGHHSRVGGHYASAPFSASLSSPPGCFKTHLVLGSVRLDALCTILSLKQFSADVKGWWPPASDQSVTVTSSTVLPGSRRSLVAGCSLLLWDCVSSLHALESVEINTAGPVLLHVNSIG